jgi:hypothetical protein
MKHNSVKLFTKINTHLDSKLYQACRFISKISMRLTAGGGPVTVKRRAVNRSTKIRSSLYMTALIFLTLYPRLKKSQQQDVSIGSHVV